MAVKLRCARPTDRMAELVDFYTGGLGLTVKGTFEGHDGYDGVSLTPIPPPPAPRSTPG